MDGVRHADAVEQAKFLALRPDEQLLEIWLNGRETNGSVADVIAAQARTDQSCVQHDRRLERLERWQIAAAAVVAAAGFMWPVLVFGLARMWH